MNTAEPSRAGFPSCLGSTNGKTRDQKVVESFPHARCSPTTTMPPAGYTQLQWESAVAWCTCAFEPLEPFSPFPLSPFPKRYPYPVRHNDNMIVRCLQRFAAREGGLLRGLQHAARSTQYLGVLEAARGGLSVPGAWVEDDKGEKANPDNDGMLEVQCQAREQATRACQDGWSSLLSAPRKAAELAACLGGVCLSTTSRQRLPRLPHGGVGDAMRSLSLS